MDNILSLYYRPTRLFGSLSVSENPSGRVLLILIIIHLIYAGALISTGVGDYEIRAAAQRDMVRYLELHQGDDTPDELNQALDALEKGAVYNQLLLRVWLLVGGPIVLLTRIGLLVGALYLLVALRGTKPDSGVLAAVVIYAHLVEVPRLVLRLALVSQLHVSRVETSAAALIGGPESGWPTYVLLRQLDPFTAWYWFLVGLGVFVSQQLRLRATLVFIPLFALISSLGRILLDVFEVVDWSVYVEVR